MGASLAWNLSQVKKTALEAARIQARTAFEKDVLYRRWNAMHGGVYVPVTPETTPNPYLQAEGREIVTPTGGVLTKVNPAYMTRQVHELGALKSGVVGHITSLMPIRSQNAPDPWEARALRVLEKGPVEEVSEIQQINGRDYMRLIRPLITEQGCLKCHAIQGYKLGDIRGGISVSVPLDPIMAHAKADRWVLIITHGLFLLLGLTGLAFTALHIRLRLIERLQADIEREKIISELKQALADIKTLEGFIPVCASCKKIRDDKGYWQQIELYIQEHSTAVFSHSICPECREKLYDQWRKEKEE